MQGFEEKNDDNWQIKKRYWKLLVGDASAIIMIDYDWAMQLAWHIKVKLRSLEYYRDVICELVTECLKS